MKHSSTAQTMRHLRVEVMELCEGAGLYQIDLLNGSKERVREAEYWVRRRGQLKLDRENAALAAAGQQPTQKKFETVKDTLRKQISSVLYRATSFEDFSDRLMPCIVRDLTDEQAITQMVEDNTNQRENILPSERAKALKMQLEAIKHQGAKEATSGQLDPKDAGRRSNEIVAERNKMTVKQVQRYIKLNDLVPDLQKMMDAGQIKFTPAVELAYIKPKNQRYIAVAIEGQQSAPSLSQAQRMRELDQKGVLNGDVIDGIMMEDKKEVDKVILTGAERGKYFGKETTPREMKDQIIKLLDDWKGQQKEVAKPEKKAAQQEK